MDATTTVGKLTVTLRTQSGHKGLSRALRTQGKVPGVCYGTSTDGRIEPLAIVVDVKALRAALDPIRKQNTVIDLTIENASGGTRSLSALVKDFQLHPTRREITHVDLLAVDPNKEVLADVPLDFIGKPLGAIEGGQLRIVMRELTLKAKPADIPVKLSVDVTSLEIGDVIHVSSIALPNGVTAVTGRDLAVVTCAAPEEEKVVAAADGAAPDAAAAAAPAAGAKDAKATAAGAKAAAGAKDAKAPAAGAKAAPAAKAAAKPAAKK